MKSAEQIARGAAAYFDAEVRPAMTGTKGVLYGVAVGTMLSNPARLLDKYGGVLDVMGIRDGEQIDVEALGVQLKQQMTKNGNELVFRLFGDDFTFHPADVDNLLRYIERA